MHKTGELKNIVQNVQSQTMSELGCIKVLRRLVSLSLLTHRAVHGRGAHTAAVGPGRDSEWLGFHLHRQQSNSATAVSAQNRWN